MNSNDFLFNCDFCDFHTDDKSNWKKHIKSKKCIALTNGIKKNFCEKCNKQFSQKSHYTAHLKSNRCMIIHKVNKDKPIDIINALNKKQTKCIELCYELYEKMDKWEDNHLLLFLAVRTPDTNYRMPKIWDDWELECEELEKNSDNVYKQIVRWKKTLKRFFTISIGRLLKNWRDNSLNI